MVAAGVLGSGGGFDVEASFAAAGALGRGAGG
jgi:hypothetical protein